MTPEKGMKETVGCSAARRTCDIAGSDNLAGLIDPECDAGRSSQSTEVRKALASLPDKGVERRVPGQVRIADHLIAVVEKKWRSPKCRRDSRDQSSCQVPKGTVPQQEVR